MSTQYKHIVILTGAGISAESGIQTFRASDGLWNNHRIEDVASPEGFSANPSLVHDFYNARRAQLHEKDIQPNAAHLALTKLEKNSPDSVLIITQNVDDLHERAGSRNVIHMHGELNKIRCQKTGRIYECHHDITTSSICDCCQEPNNLRPHIVWFGEIPLQMDDCYDALINCDLFISIGTSGHVYPAASFVNIAKDNGRAYTMEINLDTTPSSNLFDQTVHGLATQIVPDVVNALLNGLSLKSLDQS